MPVMAPRGRGRGRPHGRGGRRDGPDHGRSRTNIPCRSSDGAPSLPSPPDLDPEARERYYEWKSLLRKDRHEAYRTFSTSKDTLQIWEGALAILDSNNQESHQLLAQDMVDDGLNGPKHITQVSQNTAFTTKDSLYCAELFLKVITHSCLLDCLSIDPCVGTMYALFGGTNGERGIEFLYAMCQKASNSHSARTSESALQDTVKLVLKAFYELLNRVSRAQFCDGLQALSDLLDELIGKLAETAQKADLDALHSRLFIIKRVVAGATSRLAANEPSPSVKGGGTRRASSSFPKKIQTPGGRHDNDFADISDISILPTYEEVISDIPDYLPSTNFLHPHVLEDSLQRYIDSSFRLVRNDIVGPISDVLHDLLSSNDLSKGQLSDSDTQAQVYLKSNIRYVSLNRNALEAIVCFSPPSVVHKMSLPDQRSWWEAAPRLVEGTLVCFVASRAGGRSLLFLEVTAKVTEKDPKQTDASKSNLVSANFAPSITVKLATHQQSDVFLLTRLFKDSTKGVLVDFHGVIPGTFMPVLKNLQTIKRENHIAFQKWILPGTSDGESIPPPLYARKAGFVFSLDCIARDGHKDLHLDPASPETINLQGLEDATGLDHGQCLGLVGALTREYALIQGPPGTGKSYLGVQIIRVLLAAREQAELGPILVICYTNHALDQFLKHLLDIGIEAIIRIGGRSVAEELDGKNLRAVRKDTPKFKTEGHTLANAYSGLDSCKEAALRAIRPLVQARRGPSWQGLHHFLSRKHPEIHRKLGGEEKGGFKTGINDPLTAWLGSRPPRPARNLSQSNLQDLIRRVEKDIDCPSASERWVLADHWLEQQQEAQARLLFESVDESDRHVKTINRTHEALDQRTLARAEVVGITTTSLARNMEMLRSVKPKVVIVEEAGELKEADIISALMQSVEHLIQIGDHRQLRPTINNFSLSMESSSGKTWQLDRSQFERRAVGESGLPAAPFAQLNVQRRMRPQISRLIRSVYPKLQDHPSVFDHPNVVGMRQNVFWLEHDHMEDTAGDGGQSKSHSNIWETNMATALVRHLVRQGEYKTEDIALLAPYSGQLQQLRAALSKDFEICLSDRDMDQLAQEGYEDDLGATKPTEGNQKGIEKKQLLQTIRLATVDNFQGEEAKVIIVSLVRSNPQRKVGFLRTENRINVLLSRARHGMYLIGNSETYLKVPMWADVHGQLAEAGAVGGAFELCCPRHTDTPLRCAEPDDFEIKSPEGGCILPCSRRLEPCGHKCQTRCHSAAMHEAFLCQQPCPRVRDTCDHECPKLCGENCGDCLVKVHGIELPWFPAVAMESWLIAAERSLPTRFAVLSLVTRYLDAGTNVSVPAAPVDSGRGDARVDLLEFRSYDEVDLDESPIVVLGCGHFFTGETLDGLVGLDEVYTRDKEGAFNGLKDTSSSLARNVPFCPDCKRPIRQFATKRYNRLINRAVLDEICKRFLIKGRKDLDTLESHLRKVENELHSSRSSDEAELEGMVPVKRYLNLGKLRLEAGTLAKDMDAYHQPTKMLIDAIAISRAKSVFDSLSVTRQMEALKLSSPAPDRQIILGAQLVLIKAQEVRLQDATAVMIARKRVGIEGLDGRWSQELSLKLMHTFLKKCENFITQAKEANLPRIVVATILAFARVSRLLFWRTRSRTSDEAAKAPTDQGDTARKLLKDAVSQCSKLENGGELKEKVEEMIRLFEPRYEEVTLEELASIKSAMVSGSQGIATHSGHWYNCVNGHPFAIGECGMPMEEARCPECGERIGGSNHQALEGVSRAEGMERV
ncbi:hypothetical protein FZEAL_3970 [Fusarium zealandicum]|uniref:RZ-type domain-containing protein n=1 Tax=Fusarium zealandicum TaxID=1053134 RepID=A0A8H4UML7_9HYPO|nr:hypothetical protein FZEAL_3970 [Fusarium zealandicum]